MHEVEIDVIEPEVFEGGGNSLGDPLVPGVVEFGCYEDLGAGDAGLADAFADFFLVAVGESAAQWFSVGS